MTQKWKSLSLLAGRPITTARDAVKAHRAWMIQTGQGASSIHEKRGRWYVVYNVGAGHSGRLNAFLIEYLEDRRENTTWDTFRNVRRHLTVFGEWCQANSIRNLSDLTRRHIDHFGSWLPGTMGATTRRRYLESVRAALNTAVDWDYLGANPAARIKMPVNRQTRQARALTDSEIHRIQTDWAYPDREFAMLGMWAGLRRREIVYLAWDDIDFDATTIAVTAKPEFHHAPKGVRYREGQPDLIPLVPWLADALAGIVHEHRFVFDNGADRPMFHHNTWWCRFHRAYEASGIPNAHVHTLRHTFATKLALSGVSRAVLPHLARHLDATTTDRYTHVLLSDARREIAKLKPVR